MLHILAFKNIITLLTLLGQFVTICTTRFNIQKLYVLPTRFIFVICVGLRTNSCYFLIEYEGTGVYNRGGLCLLRGTDWIFKYDSG
jgi:hypothetical protein